MKKLVFLLCSLIAVPAAAQGVSGSVTFTSDYMFRGVSQTLEDPAVQGSIDFDFSSGFYGFVWGSNVDFESAAQAEFDLGIGWAGESANGFGLDVGAVYYGYPSESEIDYYELWVGGSWKWLSLTGYHTPDYVHSGGAGQYIELGVEFPLGEMFSISAGGGQSYFDDEVGLEDYIDYHVALGATVNRFGFEVAYVDTDTDQFGSLADDRVVFTLTLNDAEN